MGAYLGQLIGAFAPAAQTPDVDVHSQNDVHCCTTTTVMKEDSDDETYWYGNKR